MIISPVALDGRVDHFATANIELNCAECLYNSDFYALTYTVGKRYKFYSCIRFTY